MTDHDTMKRIFETTCPDQFGRAVAPSNRGGAGGGAFPPPIPLPASYIKEGYKRPLGGSFYEENGEIKYKWPTLDGYSGPSKQYTPSGAFEWENGMTPKKALAWLLMGAGVVVGVWLGAHIGFAVLVGG